MTRETLVYPRQINIRLTAAQATAIERRAAAEDRSVSSLVRYTLDKAGVFLSDEESNSRLKREKRAPDAVITAPSPVSTESGLQESSEEGGGPLKFGPEDEKPEPDGE